MSESTGAEAAPIQSSTPGTDPTPQSGPGPEAPSATSFIGQVPPVEGGVLPPSEPEAKAEAAPEGAAPAPEVDAPPPEPPDYSAITLPEGLTREDPILSAFMDAALDKGQAPEVVQAVIDSVGPKMMEALQAPFREWQNTQAEWTAAIHADPEIGGANVAQVQAAIGRMLDNPVFCDPDLRRVMDYTGAGNNPALVRSFYRIARALSEGAPTQTGRPVPQARSPAEVLYGNSNGNRT